MWETLAEYNWVSTLVVLAGALYLFVSERIAADVTALLIPVALGVLGVLAPGEAMAGFGNPAVVTVAALFVLSRALVESGAVSWLGAALQRVATGERRALAALLAFSILPSALINNTLVVVVFLPVVLQLAADRGTAPSKLLLPLSYASILGGLCTAVGTSTTVLVSSSIPEPLGFFEPGRFAWVLVLVGVAYMVLVGPKLLPVRRNVTGLTGGAPTEYVTEVQIVPGSPLSGRTLRDAVLLPHPELKVIEIVRGEQILWPGDGSLVLEDRDLLFVRGEAQAVLAIGASIGAAVLPEFGNTVYVRQRDVTLAELVVPRSSPLAGRTVREAMVRAVPGAALMAVERQGSHLRAGIAGLTLRAGDVLLIQTEATRLPELRRTEDFVLLEGLHEKLTLQRRAPLVLIITALLIVLAALELVDISFLALGAAAAMVLTRCLSPRQAYRAIDLSTLVLMGGAIALGLAIQKSGLAEVAGAVIDWFSTALSGDAHSPYVGLAAVWFITGVLTLMISNVAAAVVVLPIAQQVATLHGVSDRPFIMAVVYSASLAFATPMGYQTNVLVWNPGGYRFVDFVRFGLPLQLLLFVVGVALLPYFFPFQQIVGK